MVKQRLEDDFRKTIKERYKDYYVMKLQVNPLAHTSAPADFLLLNESNNYLVECKQCNDDRFKYDRLTQLDKMIEFENKLSKNYSYVLIMFYSGRLNTSDVYMLPVDYIKKYLKRCKRKSVSKVNAELYWKDYKVEIEKGGIINIDDYV